MVAFSKIALLAFAGASMASPSPSIPPFGPPQIFDQLKSLPASWKASGPVKKEAQIHAQIGLKQRNIDQLQAKLLDISDPDSENYGRWMSKEEIDELTAPSPAKVLAVKAWLAAHGITETKQPSADWIEFTVSIAKMESLLNAKYEMFSHETQGISVARTQQYSVPEILHDAIDLITPTTAFYEKIAAIESQPESRKSAITRRAGCQGNNVTPGCLKSMYNVDYTPTGKTIVATTKFLDVGADHGDYATFSGQYVSGGIYYDFSDVPINGGSNPGSQGELLEGNLDTQYAGGLVTPNQNDFLACGPDGANDAAFNDGMAALASYLATGDNPPNAVSTSYGGDENAFDTSYMDRVCNDFMKAGARGVSVFFSSGDSGVGSNGVTNCPQQFPNSWPAVCPWSTAVGGTQINSDGSESAAQYTPPSGYHGGTGGGFSNHFAAPAYQTADTKAYVQKLGNTNSGRYNPSHRGYPDISLASRGYNIIVNGQSTRVDGTSASSPAWAALVTLLNDYRQSNGKSNLGFINPLLYGKGRSATRDVTTGNNRGCGGNGYPATTGWDATTGLGTIDFAKLRAML